MGKFGMDTGQRAIQRALVFITPRRLIGAIRGVQRAVVETVA